MACKWINICPLRGFEKRGIIDSKWKRQYCEKDFKNCKRYIAEEQGKYHPDNLMPDGTIDYRIK